MLSAPIFLNTTCSSVLWPIHYKAEVIGPVVYHQWSSKCLRWATLAQSLIPYQKPWHGTYCPLLSANCMDNPVTIQYGTVTICLHKHAYTHVHMYTHTPNLSSRGQESLGVTILQCMCFVNTMLYKQKSLTLRLCGSVSDDLSVCCLADMYKFSTVWWWHLPLSKLYHFWTKYSLHFIVSIQKSGKTSNVLVIIIWQSLHSCFNIYITIEWIMHLRSHTVHICCTSCPLWVVLFYWQVYKSHPLLQYQQIHTLHNYSDTHTICYFISSSTNSTIGIIIFLHIQINSSLLKYKNSVWIALQVLSVQWCYYLNLFGAKINGLSNRIYTLDKIL